MMRKISVMAMLLACQAATAGVMVESSRVVFRASDPESSLMLSNTNAYPVVVQTWVDNGAPDGTPEKATDSPVMPLPGLFRLEAGEKKYLRLLSTRMKLPTDRESLYWLNIYEIPPTGTHLPGNEILVKVAVRLQLKLFYRPTSLPLSVDDVGGKLQFSVIRQPGSLALKVVNPTPYYVTFNGAEIANNIDKKIINIGMLAPYTPRVIPLDWPVNSAPKSIQYALINDDGNSIENKKDL